MELLEWLAALYKAIKTPIDLVIRNSLLEQKHVRDGPDQATKRDL